MLNNSKNKSGYLTFKFKLIFTVTYYRAFFAFYIYCVKIRVQRQNTGKEKEIVFIIMFLCCFVEGLRKVFLELDKENVKRVGNKRTIKSNRISDQQNLLVRVTEGMII